MDEFEADRPSGHVEGLTLRLYNPQAHQWSLYWANSKAGMFDGPPQVGEFKNGVGEFYCQDTFNGRMILIRYVWSGITAEFRPLRAILLRRRRQNLGSELDQRPNAHKRSIRRSIRGAVSPNEFGRLASNRRRPGWTTRF